MANNRSVQMVAEADAIQMIVTEIARVMTVSPGDNPGPQNRDLIYVKAREAFFERVNMKENEAVIARWKAFRSDCVARKRTASKIDLDEIKAKRLFDFTNANLIRFLNSESSANASTSTTQAMTFVLQKSSAKAAKPIQSKIAVPKKRSLDAITQPAKLDQLAKDEASIITDADSESAAPLFKAMRYAAFFNAQTTAMKNREDALQVREQLLKESIAKIEASLNSAK